LPWCASRRFAAVVAAINLAAPAFAQSDFDPLKASAEIVNGIANHDLDAAAVTASRQMEATSPDKVKDAFRVSRDLGHAQYTDMIYARDYGRTEKDIIYKIDFDKAFLFVRLLYHVDNGAWHLIHIHLKTEDELPFPKDWLQIYPK
jgi:hypothetical protein